MEDYKELIADLYEGLKGTREKNGELTITGYQDEDYLELYQYLLDVLKDFFDGDYHSWYNKTTTQYIRFKKANARNYLTYPHERNIYEHTVREQLAVIKFFLYRRYYSYFGKGRQTQ